MKRAGERGSGKWKRITWEQATEEIADKIRGVQDRTTGAVDGIRSISEVIEQINELVDRYGF